VGWGQVHDDWYARLAPYQYCYAQVPYQDQACGGQDEHGAIHPVITDQAELPEFKYTPGV
jgi:hypothetical protein